MSLVIHESCFTLRLPRGPHAQLPPDASCHMYVTHDSCHISMSLVLHESCDILCLPRGSPRTAHRLMRHVTRMSHITDVTCMSHLSNITNVWHACDMSHQWQILPKGLPNTVYRLMSHTEKKNSPNDQNDLDGKKHLQATRGGHFDACDVLQCVAVCCSALQWDTVCFT